MEKTPLYTIGHGNRSIEQFIELLRHFEIEYIVDVRSQPYSRYNPQFNKQLLENYLIHENIRYVSMGDVLGGRPQDESCYVNKKVDYALLSQKPFYLQGIARLRTAWEKQLRIALMCSEEKPQECHRSKLIGNTLREQQIDVVHIDEAGNLKDQEEVNRSLMKGQQVLFEDVPLVELNANMGRSRKSYPFLEEKG